MLPDLRIEKNKWPEITASNWLEYDAIIKKYSDPLSISTNYLFRGQSNAKWPLQSSLDRELIQVNANAKAALEVEFKAHREFSRHAHLFFDGREVLEQHSMLYWWGIMQHHGVPTRTLDWSKSPYAALYFAVSSLSPEDASIWVINQIAFMEKMENRYGNTDTRENDPNWIKEFQNETASPQLYFVLHYRPITRMMTQQGYFSLCKKVLTNHDQIIEEALRGQSIDNSPLMFYRIIIPKDAKVKILMQLRLMNLTAASIYGGPDGLGGSIHEQIKIQARCP